MDHSLHIGLTTRHPVHWTRTRGEQAASSESNPPPRLPAASRPLRLAGLRGRLSCVENPPIVLNDVASTESCFAYDLGIQPHDPEHSHFYKAVASYIMSRCNAVLYRDEQGWLRIEEPRDSSGEEIGKAREAVDEVRVLVDFIQRIDGTLEDVCTLLHDRSQAETIADIHSVFGGNPAEPDIQPERVLRLSNGFAAIGRPDVQLAFLDWVLLPCPSGLIKSRLAEQWIDLAGKATDEGKGPPFLLQQAIIAALLNVPIGETYRSGLAELARKSVMRESRSDVSSSLVGSPTSWNETDAQSTLTPEEGEERFGRGRRTMLMIACEHGDLAKAKQEAERCKEQGFGLDDQDAQGGTALKLASENGHLAIVTLLLEMGANPNVPDDLNRTPLVWAFDNEHVKVADALGAQGATIGSGRHSKRRYVRDSNASDTAAESPRAMNRTVAQRGKKARQAIIDDLVKACQGDEADAVRDCIARKVDVNAKDPWGQRALHYACRDGNNPKIIKLLVEAGASLEEEDVGGNTPLMVACHKGKAKHLEILLGMGANADTTNKLGMTPLMVASQLGLEDIVEQLYSAGAKLHGTCDDGRTALTYAARSGHTLIAKFLLNKGARVDHRDNKLITPLKYAASQDHTDMVDLLLSWGADGNATGTKRRAVAGRTRQKNGTFIERLGKRQRSRLKKILS